LGNPRARLLELGLELGDARVRGLDRAAPDRPRADLARALERAADPRLEGLVVVDPLAGPELPAVGPEGPPDVRLDRVHQLPTQASKNTPRSAATSFCWCAIRTSNQSECSGPKRARMTGTSTASSPSPSSPVQLNV